MNYRQAGVEWPDPRFTVSGECVTDNLTGLMWAKNGNLPTGPKTWQQALDYIASINSSSGLCGYKDWRLPNVNELESLVNDGEANPATWLVNQGFVNVQPKNDNNFHYWSSTTIALNANWTNYAWFVSMWYGTVDHDGTFSNKSLHSHYVWPVRSGQSNNPDFQYPGNIWKTGQTTKYSTGDDGDLERGVTWPSPRFTDHGDGTITDELTGLMWTKNANLAGGTETWQGALDYVKTLNIGGHSDWRLPNRKELFSLIDRSKNIPFLPVDQLFQDVFQNVQTDGRYWSSTTIAYATSSAWFVAMWVGDVNGLNKSQGGCVWPVRSPQGSLDYPDISVTPNPVAFGIVNTGAISDQTITVKNDGNADLIIGTVTTPSTPFSKFTDNCSGQTIASNNSCTVTYRFSPNSGGNFSSNSNIPSNDPDEDPVTVSLNGIGVVETMGPDLTGEWLNALPKCKKGKCKVKLTLKLENVGTRTASSISVMIYISNDNAPDPGDTLCAQMFLQNIPLGGSWLSQKLKVTLMAGQRLIAVIDPENTVTETVETNNQVVYGPIP